MAALSMRARPVDNNKPLPVLLAEDVDLKEATSVQRSLPQVSTGMEKEEEEVSCGGSVEPKFAYDAGNDAGYV